MSAARTKGVWYAIAAYTAWGMLPVYLRSLRHVPALQLVGHRVVWSCVMLVAVIVLSRQWRVFRVAAMRPRVLALYVAASILIGLNWLIYVWAVNAGYIVEVSLGYFINPLISVTLGIVFLRERLRPWQRLPLALAGAGVIYLTFVYGSLPWIALTLALSFGLYGLVKKTAPLNALFGLTLETAVLAPVALAYLVHAANTGQGAFLHDGMPTDVLLVAAGAVTAIPLLLFASAATRIPLSLVGILQYIAPTLQFLLGVLVYREPFSHPQLIGFSLVWTALLVFAIEGFFARRAPPTALGAERP